MTLNLTFDEKPLSDVTIGIPALKILKTDIHRSSQTVTIKLGPTWTKIPF